MYSNYFSINKNFQSSVNLELDLNNLNKIDEYIPTNDICDVLKFYINSALGKTKDRATTLVGPYGKGKSFLLLVLSFIFGKNKDTKTWNNFVYKIKEVDEELFDLLNEVKDKNITLLPIIINSNYDNITQSFQISLNDALVRDNLNSIIPNSAFKVCLDLIKKWESNKVYKNDVLIKCQELNNIDLEKLKNDLKSFSPNAYEQFEKLYNCINIGLEFNPLVSNDVKKIYKDTAAAIVKVGYNGIFIVFDEFSKFIEGNSTNLMKDLKIIQDMAELANRSDKENQIHLCCVTHKSLSLYNNNIKDSSALDSFKTVEGRFKEMRFNRSSEENYQIISSAIIKSSDADKYIESVIKDRSEFYNMVDDLNIYCDDKSKKLLCNGCFPLNPVTTYSLIQISEHVAQNERSLFTFLSDTNEDSFNSFLHTHEIGLFNVYKIYDYFSELFQKDNDNRIRGLWYRTESILSKLEIIEERKIVKALAIILMINDFEKLSPSEETLSLACNMELIKTKSIVTSLINRHLLRKNILNNLLSFALSNSKQIDENIELLKKTKFKNLKYSDVAEELNIQKYVLPRRYNEMNKIKRFFKVIFLSEEDFLKYKSFNYFFKSNYCDGLVIYLLSDLSKKEEINKKLVELNDERIIVKLPKDKIDYSFYESLDRYACLLDIEKRKGLDETTLSEIEIFKNETIEDVRKLINLYFKDNCEYYSILLNESKSFNNLLNITMEKLYKYKLIFNNELINKRDVTKQYQKAINNVIDYLINSDSEFNYSETSPEKSIKVAVLENNDKDSNFRMVIDQLKEAIVNSEGKKSKVSEMCLKYERIPFGIRMGIMPILIAKAISELSDNILLYYDSKEIELNASNLVKSISNDNYQISFSKGSKAQKNYLASLMKLFNCKSENSFRKDCLNLSVKIKRFFVGQPQVLRMINKENNFLKIKDEYIELKDVYLSFNINPYEAIFMEPQKIFGCKDYKKLYSYIEDIVTDLKTVLLPFKNILIYKVKLIFGINDNDSLKSGLNDFINIYIKKGSKPLLEDDDREIFNFIVNQSSYSNEEVVDKLVKLTTGVYVEDWNINKTYDVTSKLNKFKDNIINSKETISTNIDLDEFIKVNPKLSAMGDLLKNNMESVLEEFSDSVSSSDKINVLISLLKDLM